VKNKGAPQAVKSRKLARSGEDPSRDHDNSHKADEQGNNAASIPQSPFHYHLRNLSRPPFETAGLPVTSLKLSYRHGSHQHPQGQDGKDRMKQIARHDLTTAPTALSAEHVRHYPDDSDSPDQPGNCGTDPPPHSVPPPFPVRRAYGIPFVPASADAAPVGKHERPSAIDRPPPGQGRRAAHARRPPLFKTRRSRPGGCQTPKTQQKQSVKVYRYGTMTDFRQQEKARSYRVHGQEDGPTPIGDFSILEKSANTGVKRLFF
jgi:hypothetical protein